jgi:hypothetical protein
MPIHIEKLLGPEEAGDKSMIRYFVEEALSEAALICKAKAEFRIYREIKMDTDNKSLIINDIVFNINKIVFNQIKRTEAVAVLACTAGSEIGERSRELLVSDPLKGYILDIIGSLVVDATADKMQEELELLLRQSGLNITNRYSPGYCGWNVSEQHKLFRLMPDNFCGIELTKSALMNPVKSVSGIIGIGQKVKYNNYTCSYCDLKDCSFRGLKDDKDAKHKGSMA